MAKPLIRTPDGSHLPTVREQRRRTRHRKAEALRLVELLAALGGSPACIASVLDLTPTAVRDLLRLGRPRRIHEPLQLLRLLDPLQLDQTHMFRITRSVVNAGTNHGGHCSPMLACAACVAAMQRERTTRREATLERWTRNLTQRERAVSPAAARR